MSSASCPFSVIPAPLASPLGTKWGHNVKNQGGVMKPEATNRASRPDERQCALLIAHLLATKQKTLPGDRRITRARLSEISLQRMFKRQRISPELLAEVQEWLFRVG